MIRERGRGLFTTLLTFFGRCFLGRSFGSCYTIVAIHHCLYFLLSVCNDLQHLSEQVDIHVLCALLHSEVRLDVSVVDFDCYVKCCVHTLLYLLIDVVAFLGAFRFSVAKLSIEKRNKEKMSFKVLN